jgi:hypothetical protein
MSYVSSNDFLLDQNKIDEMRRIVDAYHLHLKQNTKGSSFFTLFDSLTDRFEKEKNINFSSLYKESLSWYDLAAFIMDDWITKAIIDHPYRSAGVFTALLFSFVFLWIYATEVFYVLWVIIFFFLAYDCFSVPFIEANIQVLDAYVKIRDYFLLMNSVSPKIQIFKTL